MGQGKVVTKYKVNVVEYDYTGYYYPRYRTEQTVIANSWDEVVEKAIKRTPLKHSGSEWKQYVEMVSAEDVVVGGEEYNE